jgi:hypothetical protein
MAHGTLLCGRSMLPYKCTAVLDVTGRGYENARGHSSKQPLHDLRLGCKLTGQDTKPPGSFEVQIPNQQAELS